MDDIHAWLEEHAGELAAIARRTDVGPGMVHMLAVLVLGGLADDEILGELRAHLALRTGDGDPLRHVPDAMNEIRQLTTSAPPA
jgi:hypothetical protein